MKNLTIKILSIFFAAAAVFAVAGCDTASDEFTISSLHSYDIENGDVFAGAWQITDGTGSQLSHMVYLFSGDGSAVLIIGTTGYCETYTLDTDNSEFTCQLMFGINGNYTYKADGESIVLTNIDSGETTTITRLASFDMIPLPDSDASIDDELVGAWMSEDGEYFYFDESGIMYQNQYGAVYTYFSYSAKDGKITAVYNAGSGDITDEYEYSVSGDTLTFDGYEYERTTTDNLL